MSDQKQTGKITCYFWVAFLCLVLLCIHPSQAENSNFVRWVDDGDTIVLADGRRIRYIGIDAPEIGHDGNKPQPLGMEARSFNKQLVFQKRVRIEFDQEKADHYNRGLAYVFSQSDTFINKEMLLAGLAYYLYRYPNTRYHDLLLEAQRTGMMAGRGIWLNWSEKPGRYIGNKVSRRLHQVDCPLAQKISPGNRVTFVRKWDAFWQGYAPAKDCLAGGLSQ